MNRFIFGILLIGVIGAMFVGVTSLQNVRADKEVNNTCVLDEQTHKCSFEQTYKTFGRHADIRVTNTIDASAIAGGGGNGGTVDQEARDAAANAQADVNTLGNEVSGLSGDVNSLSAKVDNATTELSILGPRIDQFSGVFNSFYDNQTTQNANFSADIAALKAALADAINDIEGGNTTTPTEPPSGNQSGNQSGGGGGGEIPGPVDNQTGGQPTDNQTGGGGEVPGPVDNQTGSGNETGTGGGNQTGNQTEFEPEPANLISQIEDFLT